MHKAQHVIRHQAVVENHICTLHQLNGTQRQQARVARACANQVDGARASGRSGGGAGCQCLLLALAEKLEQTITVPIT
jgi:hypothetical protein